MEDTRIDGLSFKLANTAPFIASRRCCAYHPQGSNIYSPGVVTKFIRICAAGPHFLDPLTLRFHVESYNTDAAAGRILCPLEGPWSVFSRTRILVGGHILDDIDMHDRVHGLLSICSALQGRESDYAEG